MATDFLSQGCHKMFLHFVRYVFHNLRIHHENFFLQRTVADGNRVGFSVCKRSERARNRRRGRQFAAPKGNSLPLCPLMKVSIAASGRPYFRGRATDSPPHCVAEAGHVARTPASAILRATVAKHGYQIRLPSEHRLGAKLAGRVNRRQDCLQYWGTERYLPRFALRRQFRYFGHG